MKSVFEIDENNQKYIVNGINDKKRNILRYVDKDKSNIKLDLSNKYLRKTNKESLIYIDFSSEIDIVIRICLKNTNQEMVLKGQPKNIEINDGNFILNYMLYDVEEIYYSLKVIK